MRFTRGGILSSINGNTKNDTKVKQIETIKGRLQSRLWSEKPSYYYSLNEYRNIYRDGVFSNVDYASHDAAAWDTEKHLCYLKDMILQYGKENVEQDGPFQGQILDGVRYWCENKFNCEENWWFNVIKVPRDLLELTLLLEPFISDELKIDVKDITQGRTALDGDLSWYQGTNLSDILNNAVMYGTLFDDKNLLNRVAEELEKDLEIRNDTESTGIRADMSYTTSHGGLDCGGSYAGDYCMYMASIIELLWDTEYFISDVNIRLLIDHILDGENYFHMGMSTAYFSNGRHAVDGDGAVNLMRSVEILAGLEGIYREDELEEYKKSFIDKSDFEAGIKAFSDTNCLVSKNKDYYIGVKGAAEGLPLMNVQNGQGVLNYNLSYGSNTCFMHDGNEYGSIGAVLDFSKWPGITTYCETDEELYQRYTEDYGQTWGWGDYAQSEGRWTVADCLDEVGIGLLSMNLLHDGIAGVLTYVSFGDGLIALGTGLKCDKQDNDKEIVTSVNQCRSDLPVYFGNEEPMDSGEEVAVSEKQYVSNDGFTYYNLCDKDMIAANNVLTGSKSRGDSAGSKEIESHNVFQLWYPWGSELEDESYAYCVIDDLHLKDRQFVLPIEELTNTATIQGVEFYDGHLAIVFHSECVYVTHDGEEIAGNEGEVVIR